MILGPGQGSDSPMFPVVMEAVRVRRVGGDRARTRPDAVMGDKAYSSRANRSLLRGRGIKAVIPEPSDQIGHRKRRGSRGGRPVNFNSETYKRRNTVERSFSLFKQWRGIAARYDKLALTLPRRRRPLRGRHLAAPIRRHALVVARQFVV
jgi:transposase